MILSLFVLFYGAWLLRFFTPIVFCIWNSAVHGRFNKKYSQDTICTGKGGSRKFLDRCNSSGGRRARTTPTFFSETKALRVTGAWLLTNLAPLRPHASPLKRDFLRPRADAKGLSDQRCRIPQQ